MFIRTASTYYSNQVKCNKKIPVKNIEKDRAYSLKVEASP
jgi:hypothetical protein